MLGSLPWMASLQAAGVVGTGTPGSCTQTALTTALTGGGTVTFNCGGGGDHPGAQPDDHYSRTRSLKAEDLITITGGLTTRLFDVTGH